MQTLQEIIASGLQTLAEEAQQSGDSTLHDTLMKMRQEFVELWA